MLVTAQKSAIDLRTCAQMSAIWQLCVMPLLANFRHWAGSKIVDIHRAHEAVKPVNAASND